METPSSQGPRRIRIEDVAAHGAFRPLGALPGIRHDLQYAGEDNFAGRNLYGAHDCAWLHHEAAAALERCAQFLAAREPALHLLVLDALRPHRMQEAMWALLKDTPLRIYLADPARGSIHSYGMAVDITLARADGRWLDMGSGFDELTERSHPEFESRFRADGTLTAAQVANRALLREAMAAGGFQGIRTEWWHFDCGDRQRVRETYLRVD
ncbi:MAG: M15 family metallopeptidase [Betaproteobacteria bacterium]|nr:M15 family metallopeptidase [Betaproteobacteria bacterium]